MCDIEKEAKTTRYDEFVSGSGALFFELRTHEGASVQRARTAKAAATLSHSGTAATLISWTQGVRLFAQVLLVQLNQVVFGSGSIF